MAIRHLTVAVAVLALASCGEPRIDSSTEERFKRSIDKVKAPLGSDEKAEFENALRLLLQSNAEPLVVALQDPRSAMRRVRDAVDGLTAEDVILALRRSREEVESLLRNEGEVMSILAEVAASASVGTAKPGRDQESETDQRLRGSHASWRESGYVFEFRRSPDTRAWSCRASPISFGETGVRSFFIDDTLVPRASNAAVATVESDRLEKTSRSATQARVRALCQALHRNLVRSRPHRGASS